jgi:hypothetical protein
MSPKVENILPAALLAFGLVLVGAKAAGHLGMLDLSHATKSNPHPGWALVVKEGAPKVYLMEGAGSNAICLRADKASFSIQRDIDVDVEKYPYLSWRWMVKEQPKGGDFREGGKDDQAAQLFVGFEGRKSIAYIWDATAPVGSEGELHIPLVIDTRIIVVKSGYKDRGGWVGLTRNVYDDYRRLFKEEPPRAKGLRFQANSQHTGTSAESCIESVEFSRSPG